MTGEKAKALDDSADAFLIVDDSVPDKHDPRFIELVRAVQRE